MNKDAFNNLVRKRTEEDKFHIIRKDSFSDFTKRVGKVPAEFKTINKKSSELPRIKYVPKIYKEGNEIKEMIAATNNSPTNPG